ncbi:MULTISPECIES: GNAT family N-acetyltransferase [unclassified Psychrobacter]|uniref:GNAT family N-acetyltransferase n=1 Tax=unclassified Psychrobacter TaxID=196806 RepID=UPI0018F32711|nr:MULTISPECIES: GNAT family N-acetyltransferase [unclassified Psychrobacter]
MSIQYALRNDTDWHTETAWQVPDTPFMSFAFWQALEDTGAIGEDAGWLPIYIALYETDNEAAEAADKADKTLLAVLPVFIKGHHHGEFVFDYQWAEAYAHYGLDYYPRLVTSVPYTPITGMRFWLRESVTLDAELVTAAVAAIDDIARQTGASGWHGLFVRRALAQLAGQLFSYKDVSTAAPNIKLAHIDANLPILERQGCQFLWHNYQRDTEQPFSDFDDFLQTLTAKKRKTIRAERRKVANAGITCVRKCGADITHEDWQIFYQCYVMTYAERGQRPYLSQAFFMQLATTMSAHLMLAQALDATGQVVASSLFLYDTAETAGDVSSLYGRYWGSLAHYDSLHFELCYYQGIEFAIERRLQAFDPGTQGEHKLIRGFVPTRTHSLHRMYDVRFVPALAQFCAKDRAHMQAYRREAHAALPFNIHHTPPIEDAL